MLKRSVTFVTIILTYFLIVFGGYVASSESGMGCGPEWPLCNGEILPDLQGETLIEFGHRFIGAGLFLLTIVLFVMVKKKSNNVQAKNFANWMLGLFILQLVMGAVVVFYHLPAIMITIHLLISLVYFSILIWFLHHFSYHTVEKKLSNEQHTWMKKHLFYVALFLFIMIGLGAYVKHQQYGMACGLLMCGESVLPQTIPELLQTVHRLFAVIGALYIFTVTYQTFVLPTNHFKKRMILASFVILLQIIIGIMTIITSISITFAVFHLAGATLIFAIVVEAWIVAKSQENKNENGFQ